MRKFWGKSAVIDLYDCNEYVKNPKKIEEFVKELCELIKMKRHGHLYLERFGDGKLEGYSFMQFIETSSITAHFEEQENPKKAFIDIFSCKDFDAEKAAEFCKNFFDAKKYKVKTIIRK